MGLDEAWRLVYGTNPTREDRRGARLAKRLGYSTRKSVFLFIPEVGHELWVLVAPYSGKIEDLVKDGDYAEKLLQDCEIQIEKDIEDEIELPNATLRYESGMHRLLQEPFEVAKMVLPSLGVFLGSLVTYLVIAMVFGLIPAESGSEMLRVCLPQLIAAVFVFVSYLMVVWLFSRRKRYILDIST